MIWCIGKWCIQSPKWCFHSPNFRQRCIIFETNVYENCEPIREYENFIGSLVRYSIDDQIYHISCIKYESMNKPDWLGNAFSLKCWEMKFSYNILGTNCTNAISAKAFDKCSWSTVLFTKHCSRLKRSEKKLNQYSLCILCRWNWILFWIWFCRIVRVYQQLNILNRFNQENWLHCKLNYVDEKGFFYNIWLNFHSNWIQSTNLGTLIDRMFKPKIQCNGNLPFCRSSQLILYSNRTLTHSKRSFIYLFKNSK